MTGKNVTPQITQSRSAQRQEIGMSLLGCEGTTTSHVYQRKDVSLYQEQECVLLLFPIVFYLILVHGI